MTEPIRENAQEMNQQAARMMRDAGMTPDETGLYVTELMKWGLENLTADWKISHPGDLLQMTERLRGKPPAEAMKFLTADGQTDLNLEGMELETGAVRALNHLHSRMAATVEGYPPVDQAL